MDAIATPAAPGRPPRLWPVMIVAVALIPCAAVVAGLGVVAGLVLDGVLGQATDAGFVEQWVMEFATRPLGFVLLFVMPQAFFLMAACVPAALSPVPLRRRLGLVRARFRWWAYPVLVASVPIPGLAGYALLQLAGGEVGEQLKMLLNLFHDASGPMAVLLLIFLSVGPGIAEELLVRGYIQRRLVERWNPAVAIALSSLLFAAAHMDPRHALAVLPLGIWLGVIAWRSGSIIPAIVCHAGNNFMGILAMRLFDPQDMLDPHMGAGELVATGVSAVAFLAALVILARARPAPPDHHAATTATPAPSAAPTSPP